MTEPSRDAGKKKGSLAGLVARLESENRLEAQKRPNRATIALWLTPNFYWVSVWDGAAQIARWDALAEVFDVRLQ